MRGPRKETLLPLATALLLSVALLDAYRGVPRVISGDAYAVYFPTAWALADGQGLQALRESEHGSARVPGYPLLLWLLGPLAGGAVQAVPVVALLSWLAITLAVFALFAPQLGPGATALAVVGLFGSPALVQASFVATPDLACLALSLTAVALAERTALRPAHGLLAGLAAAGATALRANAVYLPIWLYLVLRRRRGLSAATRRLTALGVLGPLGAWVLVSLSVKGVPFWLPSSRGASVGLHRDFLPHHRYVEQALAAEPLATLGRALWRGLISGPVEVAGHAAGWPLALLAVGALPLLWRAEAGRVWRLGGVLLGSWLLIAPVHFEARYYPVQVLALALGAAAFARQVLARGLARPWMVGIGLAALGAAWLALVPARVAPLVEHLHAEHRALAGQRALLERAAMETSGCLATDRHGWALTPFRLALREAGLYPRGCCCGPATSGLGAYLRRPGAEERMPEDLVRRARDGAGLEIWIRSTTVATSTEGANPAR